MTARPDESARGRDVGRRRRAPAAAARGAIGTGDRRRRRGDAAAGAGPLTPIGVGPCRGRRPGSSPASKPTPPPPPAPPPSPPARRRAPPAAGRRGWNWRERLARGAAAGSSLEPRRALDAGPRRLRAAPAGRVGRAQLDVAMAIADQPVRPVAEVHEGVDDRHQQQRHRDQPTENVEGREHLDTPAHVNGSVPRLAALGTCRSASRVPSPATRRKAWRRKPMRWARPIRPSTYAVGREKIREYAAAVGETNPLHHDLDAAREAGYADVVAPPMFAVVYSAAARWRRRSSTPRSASTSRAWSTAARSSSGARRSSPATRSPPRSRSRTSPSAAGMGFYVFETPLDEPGRRDGLHRHLDQHRPMRRWSRTGAPRAARSRRTAT